MSLGVPPGHLPGPGEYRVWIQGLPPGQQARARHCSGILETAPLGSWILYRPTQYQRQIRVRYLHETRQMVIAVRAFDSETGVYLRDYALEEDDNNMGPVAIGTRRPTIRPGGDRTANRGNSGNAPGRVGVDRDSVLSPGNDRGNVGRGNDKKDGSSGQANRGNQGNRRTEQEDETGESTGRRRDVTASIQDAVLGADTTGDARAERDPQINPTRRRGRLDAVPEQREEHEFLGVLPRFLPSVGMCRVWVPTLANGRQARATSCEGLVDQAPPGSWILRRDTDDPDVVLVDYVHEEDAGVIVRTSEFDAETGEPVQKR